MVRDVRLAQPPGRRSCRGPGGVQGSGGVWEWCANSTLESEMGPLTILALEPDQVRLLKRRMKSMMRLAATGELNYGKDEDVYRSFHHDLVLELRCRLQLQYPDGERAVRLYFSEPDCEERMLLAASVRTKPATEAGLDLQTEQMGEAQLRIKNHLGL